MTAHPPPAPGNKENKNNNKDLIAQERLWSVLKMLIDGPLPLKFQSQENKKERKKYHASFIPIEYLHLGQQTLLT